MSDLLDFALEAHGGLRRWNDFQTLRADLSIAGAIWEVKQCPGLLTSKTFELQTHHEELSITPYFEPGLRTVFVPDRQILETLTGEMVEAREHPETAFANQVRETPWDKFHAALFASEALWTYLTSPFLYTYPGFESEEIEPWDENGERWRRLRVTFPDHIVSHTKITHFGPDGLMRRHDYIYDYFDTSRKLFDQIAFVQEARTPERVFLEWEGQFGGKAISGVTILSLANDDRIARIRIHHFPQEQANAFAAALERQDQSS
jgi:hypothetical protein